MLFSCFMTNSTLLKIQNSNFLLINKSPFKVLLPLESMVAENIFGFLDGVLVAYNYMSLSEGLNLSQL